MKIDPDRAEAFIKANTALLSPPHVPELRLHLADEAIDLWEKTEDELHEIGLAPPFWAFAWAGGQGLARYILDNPQHVAGSWVLDFASGSGIVAIAAMKSGASRVLAADIDPFCGAAIRLNMAANETSVDFTADDPVGSDAGWPVILAGDVFYDKSMATRLEEWFDRLARRGGTILIGDPGRAYLPKGKLDELARYEVPVTRALEDAEIKRTTVWRWKG
ncbi:class I SAM-dependent methyltransferase [Notoacmeibacter ruber]|uniref:Methyltransferase n=1 Tax=Notoacmeibacter ruber TaxID=2670375 RepID=A0A3L7JE08_9HYPH|nr:methyltransferase [Notoacmeibacter ruber]RLQ89007.1 methyltransferase [Notoacmeibacter ruber]